MSVQRRLKPAVAVLVIIGLTLLSATSSLCETTSKAANKSPDYKELRLFRQVMGIVQKNYVKDVTDKELIQGAINGMLQSLDPHSSFLTEEMFKELQVETKGEFYGLGIEITLDNGVLTIVSPIEDTPAFKAGLKAGDKIIKINGESTKNITLIKAVKLMRGPKGTKVNITVGRDGWRKPKDFSLTRDMIHVHSVKKELIAPGYGYIRIVSFQESTDTDLASAIKDLGEDDSLKGMILDLRNNPGGLLDQAVKVANMFVDKGLIVYTDGRAKDQRMEFRANT
jgi:carboxyl-terminal processing protease